MGIRFDFAVVLRGGRSFRSGRRRFYLGMFCRLKVLVGGVRESVE